MSEISRVVDPHGLNADQDPAIYLNADPDPDPGSHFNGIHADPNPGPTLPSQKVEFLQKNILYVGIGHRNRYVNKIGFLKAGFKIVFQSPGSGFPIRTQIRM
jgi:hypothetical protein